MTNIFRAIQIYVIACNLKKGQATNFKWMGILPIYAKRDGEEVTFKVNAFVNIIVKLDRDDKHMVFGNTKSESVCLVSTSDIADFLNGFTSPTIRAAFAKAGYRHIDIHNDGKTVRIYDAETCEYYATANFENGGYTIWPNDVDFPDPIGRVELN